MSHFTSYFVRNEQTRWIINLKILQAQAPKAHPFNFLTNSAVLKCVKINKNLDLRSIRHLFSSIQLHRRDKKKVGQAKRRAYASMAARTNSFFFFFRKLLEKFSP